MILSISKRFSRYICAIMLLVTLCCLPVVQVVAQDGITPDSAVITEAPDQNNPAGTSGVSADSPGIEENTRTQGDSPAGEVRRQAMADRTRYEKTVADLEARAPLDTYDAELSEAYMDLASVLSTLGLFDEAEEAYDKALQRIRISNGLDSTQQLPVMEALLANNIRKGDWKAVDANSQLIFHIKRRNYPVGDERRLRALEQLGEWKLKAAREQLFDGYASMAREAALLYSSEIAFLDSAREYEGKQFDLATLHLGEARTKLVIAQILLDRPLSEFGISGQKTFSSQVCRIIRLPDGRFMQVCETVEVPNTSYYLEPAMRKNQEINTQLTDVREAITGAYQFLQTGEDMEQRARLLTEVRELTAAYNAFVTDNAL